MSIHYVVPFPSLYLSELVVKDCTCDIPEDHFQQCLHVAIACLIKWQYMPWNLSTADMLGPLLSLLCNMEKALASVLILKNINQHTCLCNLNIHVWVSLLIRNLLYSRSSHRRRKMISSMGAIIIVTHFIISSSWHNVPMEVGGLGWGVGGICPCLLVSYANLEATTINRDQTKPFPFFPFLSGGVHLQRSHSYLHREQWTSHSLCRQSWVH